MSPARPTGGLRTLHVQPLRTVSVLTLVSALAGTGCGVGINCAPPQAKCNSTDGRTIRSSGTPVIDRVIVDCCDDGTANPGTCAGFGEWWADVLLEGTASRVVLTLSTREGGAWTEEHTLSLEDQDPAGHWEIRYADWGVAETDECATYADCADLFQSSARTLFECPSFGADSLRYVVEVYDGSTTPVDCVTWGSAFIAAPSGCRDAIADGVL